MLTRFQQREKRISLSEISRNRFAVNIGNKVSGGTKETCVLAIGNLGYSDYRVEVP